MQVKEIVQGFSLVPRTHHINIGNNYADGKEGITTNTGSCSPSQ